MSKKKEAKGTKNETTMGITWAKGKPTGDLIHNCVNEILKKMKQCGEKNVPQQDFDKIYSKIINKHAKIIEKNMGISTMSFKFNFENKPIYKEGKYFNQTK